MQVEELHWLYWTAPTLVEDGNNFDAGRRRRATEVHHPSVALVPWEGWQGGHTVGEGQQNDQLHSVARFVVEASFPYVAHNWDYGCVQVVEQPDQALAESHHTKLGRRY